MNMKKSFLLAAITTILVSMAVIPVSAQQNYYPEYDPNIVYARYDLASNLVDPGYPQYVSPQLWPNLGLDGIDSALNWGNGKAYFFGGIQGEMFQLYTRYDIASDCGDSGYPIAVSNQYWPNLGLAWVSAAVNWGNGKIYLFGYDQNAQAILYSRWSTNANYPDEGYPQVVNNSTWPGLEIFTEISAAVNWGNGKAYFFGRIGNDYRMYYTRYDIAADRADEGYPKLVDDSTWPGMYIDYISGAVNWYNGKVYFFGYQEVRY